jgi:hypothetical protein
MLGLMFIVFIVLIVLALSFAAFFLFNVESNIFNKINTVRSKSQIELYVEAPDKSFSHFIFQLLGSLVGLVLVVLVNYWLINWASSVVIEDGLLYYAFSKAALFSGYAMIFVIPFTFARELKSTINVYVHFKRQNNKN